MMFYGRIRRNAVKLEGERSSALDLARGRLVLMSGFFIIVYMVFAVRAFDLAVIQGHSVSRDAGRVVMAMPGEALPALNVRRADITDRNGVLLATTLKTSALFADPYLIADADGAAKKLVKIFPNLKYGDVLQKLQSSSRFEWIDRNVSPDQQFEVLQIGEPGLDFKESYKRFYPQGPLAAHLLGYSNVDAQGLAGVERGFNKHLSEGHDLKLTLDVRLQHALRREVLAAMDEFEAPAAAGAIMDVTTGEILAGVSLPDFNPHHPPGKKNKDAMFNRLTLGAYELGSVFKIFSTAAFFERHDVPMSTKFDASEPIKIGRFTINDYHAEDRELTIPEVFMYSSNIGSALMGQSVGTEGLRGFYKDLGLLDPLDFEVREVARPLVPKPWREISTLTASYGHGLSTTPLQLVTAVSSVVNGGYLVKPSLVLDEETDGQESEEVRVVSAKTAQRMRQLLRLVVTDGTASKAEVKGLRVGGKTGTAEKIVNGKYDNKKKISSFVGVFPMDAPRYAVFVMVDEPKGQKHTWNYATGGWVAAPAVARVVASMASILGIPPVSDDSPESHFGESLKQFVSAKEEQ